MYFLAEESAAGAVAGPARSPPYSGDENRGTVREEILADLRDLGLFEDAGQLKAVE
jgi:hypothetical protein